MKEDNKNELLHFSDPKKIELITALSAISLQRGVPLISVINADDENIKMFSSSNKSWMKEAAKSLIKQKRENREICLKAYSLVHPESDRARSLVLSTETTDLTWLAKIKLIDELETPSLAFDPDDYKIDLSTVDEKFLRQHPNYVMGIDITAFDYATSQIRLFISNFYTPALNFHERAATKGELLLPSGVIKPVSQDEIKYHEEMAKKISSQIETLESYKKKIKEMKEELEKNKTKASAYTASGKFFNPPKRSSQPGEED